MISSRFFILFFKSRSFQQIVKMYNYHVYFLFFTVINAAIFVSTNKEKYLIMKTLQTLIIIAVLSLGSLVANATTVTPLELKVMNTTTVQIKTSIVANVNETFEIQRSYNNKDFKQVGLIIGSEDAANLPALKFSDKISTKESIVYYRIVKLNTDGTDTIVAKSIIEMN
jgi:hypothetical protein